MMGTRALSILRVGGGILARQARCKIPNYYAPSDAAATNFGRGRWPYSSNSGSGSIYEEFDVFSGGKAGLVIINSYDDSGFTANGFRHEGSIICLGKLIFSWSPRSLAEITPESLSLFQLLRPSPEILVVGCGKRLERLSPEVRDFLKSNGIKIEAVDTRHAASTFNILNEEGRQVALAMLPYGYSS